MSRRYAQADTRLFTFLMRLIGAKSQPNGPAKKAAPKKGAKQWKAKLN